jgi:hypothetical protein
MGSLPGLLKYMVGYCSKRKVTIMNVSHLFHVINLIMENHPPPLLGDNDSLISNKKFTAFCGHQNFITVLTRTCNWTLMSHLNSVHTAVPLS